MGDNIIKNLNKKIMVALLLVLSVFGTIGLNSLNTKAQVAESPCDKMTAWVYSRVYVLDGTDPENGIAALIDVKTGVRVDIPISFITGCMQINGRVILTLNQENPTYQ